MGSADYDFHRDDHYSIDDRGTTRYLKQEENMVPEKDEETIVRTVELTITYDKKTGHPVGARVTGPMSPIGGIYACAVFVNLAMDKSKLPIDNVLALVRDYVEDQTHQFDNSD